MWTIKANDTTPPYEATLRAGTGTNLQPVNLVGVTSVSFYMRQVEGEKTVSGSGVVADAEGGIVRYLWADGDTDTPGLYEQEWEVVYADARRQTFPSDGYNALRIHDDIA